MKKTVKMFLSNPFKSDPRVYKEASYLVKQGYDVEVICWNRDKEYLANDIIEGVKVTRLHYPSLRGQGIIKQLVPYIKFLKESRSIINKTNREFLHFHDLDTAITLLTVLKRKNKIIVDLHEQPDKLFKGFLKKVVLLILKFVVKKCDWVIIVNNKQLEDYKKTYFKKNVVEIKNLPEKSVFDKYQKISSPKLRISFIGSVRDEKSLSTLIETFKNHSVVDINIIGEGTAQKKLFSKYSSISNVNFVDFFEYKDIVRYYNQTDIVFAMYDTSNENYNMAIPVKVYEAIICEIPVIVSRKSAVGNFVNRTKIGITVISSEELKQRVELIIENKHIYDDFKNNIKIIKDSYIWENEVKKLKQIYEI